MKNFQGMLLVEFLNEAACTTESAGSRAREATDETLVAVFTLSEED